MKKQLLLVSMIIVLFAVPSALWAKGSSNVKLARGVVAQLNQGEYGQIRYRFDDAMKRALPVSRLKGAWVALTAKGGKLQQELGTVTANYDGYDIVVVSCKFERTRVNVKVVFDKSHRIAGLFFLPDRGAVK